MDSKGLDVCNSLERDKACWRCCCLDGRKAACHDGLDSLTDSYRRFARTAGAPAAPAQFIATKAGEEAQTGPAEYLAALAIMSKGQYSFEVQSLQLQCSLSRLTTTASAHKADQSMQGQSSPHIKAPNHLWGDWAKTPLPKPLVTPLPKPIFKICRGCTKCRPNFWPDLD